jgi:hypothetical protein
LSLGHGLFLCHSGHLYPNPSFHHDLIDNGAKPSNGSFIKRSGKKKKSTEEIVQLKSSPGKSA